MTTQTNLHRDWLTAAEPMRLVELLSGTGRLGSPGAPRKLRLFAAACIRACWGRLGDQRPGLAIQVAELFAAGRATVDELREAQESAGTALIGHPCRSLDRKAAELADLACDPELRPQPPAWAEASNYATFLGVQPCTQAAIVRDLFPDPFRPAPTEPCRWAERARGLAATIDAGRLYAELPTLGRALGDAGVSNWDVLGHCWGEAICADCFGSRRSPAASDLPCEFCGGRGSQSISAVHVRGCWVLDLMTGVQP